MHIVNETMYYLRLFLNSAGFIKPGVLLGVRFQTRVVERRP